MEKRVKEVLTEREKKRLENIYKGIDFKLNKHTEEYSGYNWNILNEELGLPYEDGEKFRQAVKYFQTCLREPNGKPKHKYALPRAKGSYENLIELQKEKVKLSSLRNDINKNIRETARQELLLEEFVRAVEDNKYYKPKFERLQKQKSDTEHVFAFGDVHFGKKFKSMSNEYSVEIAKQRFEDMYNEICDYIETENVSLLHIISTGDSVEGMHLRVSQLQSLQIGLTDQVIQYSNLLINWLGRVSEKVKIKYYPVKSSNHSQTRPYNSKPNEFTLEDMERMIINNIKLAFDKKSRVEVMENDERFLTVNLLGYEIIILHGHEARDLNNLLRNMAWKQRKFFDYAFVGHNHTSGIIGSGEGDTNNCEVIRIPSVMGSDEYADQLMLGSKAGATFIKFNKRQGKRGTVDVVLN